MVWPLKGMVSRWTFFLSTWKKIESENLMNYINAENFKEIDRMIFFLKVLKFGFFTSLFHVYLPGLHPFFVSFYEFLFKKNNYRYRKLPRVRYMCFKCLWTNIKTLTEAFLRFRYFCSSFWRPFLLYISKFCW